MKKPNTSKQKPVTIQLIFVMKAAEKGRIFEQKVNMIERTEVSPITNTIFSRQCTEMRFASFLSGKFTTMAVMNSPERNVAKLSSLHWVNPNYFKQQQYITMFVMQNFSVTFTDELDSRVIV